MNFYWQEEASTGSGFMDGLKHLILTSPSTISQILVQRHFLLQMFRLISLLIFFGGTLTERLTIMSSFSNQENGEEITMVVLLHLLGTTISGTKRRTEKDLFSSVFYFFGVELTCDMIICKSRHV